MLPIWTFAVAAGVGFCIGAAGVGGIILVPALMFAGLTTRQAQSTSLFTFLFTGIYGAWLFQRRGSIQWREALPVCAGAAVFSYLGAWANSLIAVGVLNLVVAVIMIAAGVYLLIPQAASNIPRQQSRETVPLLLGV